MKHVKAFTAAFKIDAVRSGQCTQTIRPLGKRPVSVGDYIMLHGWQSRPYASKWSWRLNVKVIEVINVELWPVGITYPGMSSLNAYWWVQNELAERDGFKDGEAMGEYFNDHYDLSGGKPYQIIRWEVPDNNGSLHYDSYMKAVEWGDTELYHQHRKKWQYKHRHELYGIPLNGKSHCSICGKKGHNRRTCNDS